MCHVTVIPSVFFQAECLLTYCDNTFPLALILERRGSRISFVEFKSFCMEHTQGEGNLEDGQVPKPSDLTL
jgi:hypothetical protein